MSQDMMQALSGSSLMSLSVGTLPAVKSGMMLDANPFASQLALMTGADGSLAGASGYAPGLGDGNFAATLAGQSATDAASDAAAAPVPADILALPEDASPSQILEAVLKGTITPGATKAGPADMEAFVPQALPEAVDADALMGDVDSDAERPAAKPGTAVASAADAVPLAAPFIPPATPAPIRPEAIAPETGSARTAISAQPSVTGAAGPDMAAGDAAPAGEDVQSTRSAAASEIVQATQIQASGQVSVPSVRGTASAQRAIEAATRSARPDQAPAAVSDVDETSAQSVGSIRRSTALGTGSQAVPPSWAAALNAVVPPATGESLQELAAPLPTGPAEAAPLETLMFDADFIGSVETQIARVIGGSQMVRMQISPEHLGRIDIEMLAGPERDHVRITTEHDAVRDTLVQSQVRLEQDLRNTSQRTADVTVELRQQSPGTQGGSAQQQRGQAGQDAGSARDAMARQTAADAPTDSTPAQRRLRGNVRYA
ncbi:flagellar hook-length control protein FliK [Blastomonas sp.]|uniref:flagellar hook-length control protein FliK n=1 Tax=Blastomonas sp. TaxID=1909299 RepID=UPI002617DF49|nr:flagellar hook-length control protein FliK [Blastomonas sp.]MDM7955981.1 flagellar hook-length control protein FliK [Blastomonas sp.]